MLPAWKERYSVHHTILDAQHKELFRLAAKVHGLDAHAFTKEKVRQFFGEFFQYMKKHFEEEEAYMEILEYPELNEHKALHEEIIQDVTNVLKKNHSLLEIRTQMKRIVELWLVDHILEHDLRYEKWRQEKHKIDLRK